MKNVPKHILKAMALADRLMDEGKMPYVMALGPNGVHERMPMTDLHMKEFGLTNGQTVGTVLRDAIIDFSVKLLSQQLADGLDDQKKKAIDEEEESVESKLAPDFDFRDLMDGPEDDSEDDQPRKNYH